MEDPHHLLCEKCARFMAKKSKKTEETRSPKQGQSTSACVACLGLWQDDFGKRLKQAILQAAKPYNAAAFSDDATSAAAWNVFSRKVSPPCIVLTGDLVARYQALIDQRRSVVGQTTAPPPPPLAFANALKDFTKRELDKSLDQIELEWKQQQQGKNDTKEDGENPSLHSTDNNDKDEEELGHLAVHIIVTPSHRVPCLDPALYLHATSSFHSKKRQRNNNFLKRKQTFMSQGGDPRRNLESRLEQQQGKNANCFWSINQALEKNVFERLVKGDHAKELEKLLQPIVEYGGSNGPNNNDNDTSDTATAAYEIHVAVWRRPFYVRSEYTKIRRDVSQTPFYVEDDGKRRKLGISSVEEEILPILVKYCGGISPHNHDPNNETTRFGMAKFHGSGREDMDVRMILPDPETRQSAVESNQNITGRPFVCEITDALRLPSMHDLKRVVLEINHVEKEEEILAEGGQSYGKNPNGVGIAPGLKFVSSTAFKNLQADTEDKVKHYGCLCWSKNVLPDLDEELRQRLGTFPLAIEQRTPIRVLHRRSNMIRNRRVLSCRVRRIDDHYFRLFISTDAGTYVKEFVHGDLRRTVPSVGSILGCKVDILELDCEGIES